MKWYIYTPLFIILRVLQALVVVTYFNPDEYWQNQEVAYTLVFPFTSSLNNSNGDFKTWEWADYASIRGYLHPFLTAGVYYFLARYHLDTEWLIAWSPRLMNAVLCGIADAYFFNLVAILLAPFQYISPPRFQNHSFHLDVVDNLANNNSNNGDKSLPNDPITHFLFLTPQKLQTISFVAIAMWLFNWFAVFCYPRAFSNSVETSFIIIALYYWPYINLTHNQCFMELIAAARTAGAQQTLQIPTSTNEVCFLFKLTASLVLAAFGVVLRPTSAIIWIPLYIHAIISSIFHYPRFSTILYKLFIIITMPLFIGVAAVLFLVEVDSWGYSGHSAFLPLKHCLTEQFLVDYHSTITPAMSALLSSLLPSFISTNTTETTFLTWRRLFNVFPVIKDYLTTHYITQCVLPNINTLSIYNFYRINKSYDIASLYGVHPPFFSIFASIPVVTAILFPFLLYTTYIIGLTCVQFLKGLINQSTPPTHVISISKPSPNRPHHDIHTTTSVMTIPSTNTITSTHPYIIQSLCILLYCAYFLPFFYSLNRHQEYRFILPSVPFLYLLCAWGCVKLFDLGPSMPLSFPSLSPPTLIKYRTSIIFVLCAINLILTIYFCRWHQSGPIPVLRDISAIKHAIAHSNMEHFTTSPLSSSDYSKSNNFIHNIGVAMLTSCHSTPHQSFLHTSPSPSFSPIPITRIFSPDCSPLFSNHTHHSVQAPCRLSRDDQYKILHTITTHRNINFSRDSDQILNAFGQNCTSPSKTPNIPGKNWLSEHEQIKTHPIFFFLRHIVIANLILQNDHLRLLRTQFPSFYNIAIELYTYHQNEQHISHSNSHRNLIYQRLFDAILNDFESAYGQNPSNVEPLIRIKQQLALSTVNHLSKTPHLTSSYQYNNNNDPFFEFHRLFSFPQSTTPFTTQNTFFPDIIVMFNPERDALVHLLELFDFEEYSRHFHSHLEPDEKYLYIYVHRKVLNFIRQI